MNVTLKRQSMDARVRLTLRQLALVALYCSIAILTVIDFYDGEELHTFILLGAIVVSGLIALRLLPSDYCPSQCSEGSSESATARVSRADLLILIIGVGVILTFAMWTGWLTLLAIGLVAMARILEGRGCGRSSLVELDSLLVFVVAEAALLFLLTRAFAVFPVMEWLLQAGTSVLRILPQAVSHNIAGVNHMIIWGGQKVSLSTILPVPLIVLSIAWGVVGYKVKDNMLRVIATQGLLLLIVTGVFLWLAKTTLCQLLDNNIFLGFVCGAHAIISYYCQNPKLMVPFSTRSLATAIGVFVLFVIVGGVVWLLPQDQEQANIWIDESHGSWEEFSGILDTLNYARGSQYNYWLLGQALNREYRCSVLVDSIPENINCEVLLIKLPTRFYSASEKERIRRYVATGGILLVISDHTNLFGSQQILNNLLAPYRLQVQSDATLPFQGRDYVHRFKPTNSSFSFENTDSLIFQTSCTFRATDISFSPLLITTRAVAEDAEYSDSRFFGPLIISPDDRRGPLCLAGMIPYGHGLVIVFGDSTIWSSFSLNTPPNKQLFFDILYLGLMRPDRSQKILLLVALTLACGYLWWRRASVKLSLLAIGLGLIWLPLLIPLRHSYDLPDSGIHEQQILVDMAHSSMDLSTDIRTGRPADLRNYSAFIATLPRTGLGVTLTNVDFVTQSTETNVMVVNPSSLQSIKTMRSMREFLRNGGHLLLLLNKPNFQDTSGIALARELGAGIRLERCTAKLSIPAGPSVPSQIIGIPFSLVYKSRHQESNVGFQGVELRAGLYGMEPLLVDNDGICVFGRAAVGRGQLLIFLAGDLFSQYSFGDVWGSDASDPVKRDLYSLCYFLTREFCRRP